MMKTKLARYTLYAIMAAAGAAFMAVSLSSTEAIFAMGGRHDGMHDKGAKFDSDGMLTRPEGYRKWMFVGTPVTPNDMNDGKAPFPEFHVVYIDHASYKVYKKTGEFPQGTILVKELISVGTKKAASGNGYFMGKYIGLEATVKDIERFPDEPGGWAYFSFTTEGGGEPKDKAAAMPTAVCNACHEKNAGEDWVFTQYYPVLTAARMKM